MQTGTNPSPTAPLTAFATNRFQPHLAARRRGRRSLQHQQLQQPCHHQPPVLPARLRPAGCWWRKGARRPLRSNHTTGGKKAVSSSSVWAGSVVTASNCCQVPATAMLALLTLGVGGPASIGPLADLCEGKRKRSSHVRTQTDRQTVCVSGQVAARFRGSPFNLIVARLGVSEVCVRPSGDACSAPRPPFCWSLPFLGAGASLDCCCDLLFLRCAAGVGWDEPPAAAALEACLVLRPLC